MPLKTPKFWHQTSFSPKAFALTPIAWLYQIGHRLNQYFKPAPHQASIPVICIGNAVAGGSGKTPTAIALMKLIQQEEFYKNPHFLTRGYGGETDIPCLVDLNTHKAAQVGDEPLLLTQTAPTIVSKNRKAGADLAETQGADIIIMDDGLQNNNLHKDLSFLVIDRAVNFGNGKTIPAGPLREPLSQVIPKADAVICIGAPLHSDKPVFTSQINASDIDLTQKYFAFAGLGRPEKFLNTLKDLNANIVGWQEFADHHLYTAYEMSALLEKAKNSTAQLITTEKDFMRLPEDIKPHVTTLPITLDFDDTKSVIRFLSETLK